MTRSVNVETHTEVVEWPGLFDHFDPSSAFPVRYRIYFEFREDDTLVYHKSFYLTRSPQDKYFRLKLLEAFEKEIKDDKAFQFTKWNVPEGYKYKHSIEDQANILPWMEEKHILALLNFPA